MLPKFLRRMSLAVIGLVAASAAFGQPGELSRSVLQGAWEQVDGPGLLRFQDDQLFRIEQGRLLIRGIVHYRPGSLVLRTSGELETWQATPGENGHLRLGHGDLNLSGAAEAHEHRKLPSVPAALELQPLTLGPMQPLPPERVQAIQQELASHNEQEQKERREKAIVTDNTDYLVKLVQEVGWIDVARFGEKASVQATIMIKHTGSLPFMIAVLPSGQGGRLPEGNRSLPAREVQGGGEQGPLQRPAHPPGDSGRIGRVIGRPHRPKAEAGSRPYPAKVGYTALSSLP